MILVIDCGSNKTPQIVRCVDEYMDVEAVSLENLSEKDLSTYKGIIISGAPILLTEVDYQPYLEQFAWVKEYSMPILGICFGHQLLGLIHGAAVTRQKEDRDWQTIEIIEDDDLFNRFPKEFEMMEDHCETVSIPGNFTHLAVSDACINEAMKHKDKPFYGVQFHPEVSGNIGYLLFDNFTRICLKLANEEVN